MRKSPWIIFAALLATVAAPNAHAGSITINFDAQAVGHPVAFDGTINSPLTIGIATFTGGELLINEISGIDATGVYATTNVVTGPYVDPLTITFSQGVSAFSLLLTNNQVGTYVVMDNFGVSAAASLGTDASETFSLLGTGITSVTIEGSTTMGQWDFAIDNVSFTPSATATPEPSTVILFGTSLLGLVPFRKKLFGR